MRAKYNDILVCRLGTSDNAYMITMDVVGEINGTDYYKINNLSLDKTCEIIDEPNVAIRCKSDPPHITISGIWTTHNHLLNETNILGKIGEFIVTDPNDNITIPIAETTKNNLAFYSAELYKIGDTVHFNTSQTLPVTTVCIGEDYISNYMMEEQYGNGVYIERHDRPHFHMALHETCGGFLILGKKKGNKYLLSAFRIPYGMAIYTPPNIIHNDCYLVGYYLVIYSITDDYSTVRLVDRDHKIKKIEIA